LTEELFAATKKAPSVPDGYALRLPQHQMDQLRTTAQLSGVSVAHLMRALFHGLLTGHSVMIDPTTRAITVRPTKNSRP
jgi:hypothetical protein